MNKEPLFEVTIMTKTTHSEWEVSNCGDYIEIKKGKERVGFHISEIHALTSGLNTISQALTNDEVKE